MRGLYDGRFDPFHRGHLKAYNMLASLVSDVVIGIGADRSDSLFSLDERAEMIIQNTGVEPIILEDLTQENPLYWDWGQYVLNEIGPVDLVATGNHYVRDDFFKHDVPVLWLPRYDGISGTRIRELIISGDEAWIGLVPQKTKTYVSTIYKSREE